MKFYETHFEDYCKSWDKLHENEPEAEKMLEFPAKTPQDIIVYGSSGVGKYTHVLSMLRPYSPSGLKHDKKIKASTDKQSYTYRISDIHYEVDMSLLGCNSKIIWHEIYSQIVDIVTIKPEKMGFIVCKNFHAIHNELLEIFYSYMQQHCYGYEGKSREVQIYFILITEHVSFLPNPLLEHCHIVRIPRPTRQVISSFAHIHKSKDGVDPILNTIETEHIINIKEVYSFSLIPSLDKLPTDHFNMVCDTLIQEMILIMRPTEKKELVKVAPEGCIPNASVLRSANEVCNNGVQASEACRGLMTSASGSTMKESNEPPESFYQGVSHNPFMLPPRKTNMDYIPVQENVGMLREKEDVCSYEPNHPQCSTKWNMFRENVVEGMDDGGGFGGADFGKFIEVFFEMIGFIIYILVTLPDHIIAFVEGFVWLILAGVDLFIAGFELFALQLQDMGILIADLFTCGMTMQENLPICTIFWFLDFAIFVILE